MPNDAKLGLVVGVGLVIAFAVVFFRKIPEAATPNPEAGSIAVPAPQGNAAPPRTPVPPGQRTSALPAAAAREHVLSLRPARTPDEANGDRIDRALLKPPGPLPSVTLLASPDLERPAASVGERPGG
jgi:hypothetical protein